MKTMLKSIGLKATRHRVAILEALEQAGGEALTAEALFERLHPQTGMDRSTVYRCLEALEGHGLVERMEHRNGACYCLTGRDHRHLLVCTRCRKTVSIPGCPLREMEQSLSRSTGFVHLTHTLELSGLCPECAGLRAE